MRPLWNLLETFDRTVMSLLDQRDRLLGREELLARTKKATAEVKPPQRLITLDN
jgi:hypothetical protein